MKIVCSKLRDNSPSLPHGKLFLVFQGPIHKRYRNRYKCDCEELNVEHIKPENKAKGGCEKLKEGARRLHNVTIAVVFNILQAWLQKIHEFTKAKTMPNYYRLDLNQRNKRKNCDKYPYKRRVSS